MALSMTPPRTTEEKLRSLLSQNGEAHHGPTEELHGVAARGGTSLTEWELDLLDWGFVYGMAFALCRDEEPWESLENVSRRAHDVAREAHVSWGGVPCSHPRPDFATDHEGLPA